MDCSELSFTAICRCCKRKASGMTSIFDGSVHSTHPPVYEMLKSIASLNVQENDGLPSLVCKSCLNSIQKAFTFILRIIQIDEELTQMLAKRKHSDTLPVSQSTNHTRQCVRTKFIQAGAKFVENFDEYGNLAIKVEPLDTLDCDLDEDEPMLTFNQHGSADNEFQENIDFVVKTEVVHVPEIEETNELELQLAKYFVKLEPTPTVIAFSDSNEDIEGSNSFTSIDDNHSANLDLDAAETYEPERPKRRRKTPAKLADSDNLFMVQKGEEEEDEEYIDIMGVDDDDEDYQENVEDDSSVDSSSDEGSCLQSQKSQRNTKLQKSPSKQTVFNCTLCAFTHPHISQFKLHLQSHFKDKPFACSKCNQKFSQKSGMLCHWRNCNGEIKKSMPVKRKASIARQVISLTLQDLEDSEKVKEYYTMTEIDVWNDDDSKTKLKRPIRRTVFKCKLCAFTTRHKGHLKRHLQTHSIVKPYTCTKCNRTFTQSSNMQRHNCHGDDHTCDICHHRNNFKTDEELQRHRVLFHERKEPKEEALVTPQELGDPLKMKKFYTAKKFERGQEKEIDKICPKARNKRSNKALLFQCKLCGKITTNLSRVKRHLQTHCKDMPFECSKCNGTFADRHYMVHHWQNCNGNVKKQGRNKGKASKLVMSSLTLQDLEDPLKMQDYYTILPEMENNEDDPDDDLQVQNAGNVKR